MGQRANLVILERGTREVYYSHWCAGTLERDLFWGPEHALAFTRMQRRVDDSGWLDETWAEGAAVVDCDRRKLVLFGGEDINHDIPLRRVYLQLLGRSWAGWEVAWAHGGIVDVAEYVGHPREDVLARDYHISSKPIWDGRLRWVHAIASVLLPDGRLRIHPIRGPMLEFLLPHGPGILQVRDEAETLDSLDLGELEVGCFPCYGFHVDVGGKVVTWWDAHVRGGLVDVVRRAWEGWEMRWVADRYEAQVSLTAGRLRMPQPRREALMEYMRQVLLGESSGSCVDLLLQIAERDRAEGRSVQLNSMALREDRRELARDISEGILDRVCAQIRLEG